MGTLNRNRSVAWKGGCEDKFCITLHRQIDGQGTIVQIRKHSKAPNAFAKHICPCLTKFMLQLFSLNKLENRTKRTEKNQQKHLLSEIGL